MIAVQYRVNMRRFFIFCFFFIAAAALTSPDVAGAGGREIFLREEFENLDNWKPIYFPKIERHSTYSIERKNDEHYLRTESDRSASGILLKREFNVYNYPKVRWKWKVANIYGKGELYEKSGDDYPIRIYIVFKYDPGKADILEKFKYNMSRLLYGEYPPHSTLNYVWAGRDAKTVFTSPYTDKAKLIPLQMGDRNVGSWQEETVDIIRDYKAAFGTDPPPVAAIGIMSDSDDTGERAISYVKFVEVFRDAK
jgi:hypothetical protein